MIKDSKTYIIGIDISDNKDESVMTVCRSDGSKLTHVNTLTGAEVERLYRRLVGDEKDDSTPSTYNKYLNILLRKKTLPYPSSLASRSCGSFFHL